MPTLRQKRECLSESLLEIRSVPQLRFDAMQMGGDTVMLSEDYMDRLVAH